jgi:type II secretory pathway predicted ATPase ExeA/septal ring-binding cell division protein DamX
MYEEYFGLERPPFKITPDTSLFYEGGKRGDILAALAYTIHRGEGIIKVVGEVGSGKTMLCRMLQLKLPDSVEIVYIANPSVSAEDILFVIAHELSLTVARGASKHEVMHMLQDYLLQRHTENRQVVLFIEEAQGMPLDTLEEIRLLSNLETDENKLLQIILFGQPELDQNLSHRSIRQLRERITHNFELEPLTQSEIHNYLNFRMRQVGYTGPELISNTVAKKVEQHSAGLLRRINIIADKILLSAFAEGTHNLSAKHVTAAVNDSSFSQEAPRRSRLLWWLGPLILLAIGVALYQTRSQWLALVPPELMSQPQAGAETGFAATDEAPLPASTAVAEAALAAPAPDPVVVTPPDSAETPEPPQAIAGTALGADDIVATPPESVPAQENANFDTLNAQVDALVTQVSTAVQQAQAQKPQAQQLPAEQPQAEQPQAEQMQTTQPRTERPLEDQAVQPTSVQAPATHSAPVPGLTADYQQWLDAKLAQSEQWLSQANRNKMSIQVMMRSKSAARKLVYYLRNEWPLDLSKTYMYEVIIEGRTIYRVFYGEYDNLKQARSQIDRLPQSIKVNSPYVHSIYRMRKALL